MFGWRRCLLTLRWRCKRRDGHRILRLVDHIRDEHSRNGVFLAAELRKVNLPYILNARGRKKDLHRFGLCSFSRAVVGHDHAWAQRLREKFCIDVSMTCRNQEIHCSEAIAWTHQLELSVQSQIA